MESANHYAEKSEEQLREAMEAHPSRQERHLAAAAVYAQLAIAAANQASAEAMRWPAGVEKELATHRAERLV